MKSSKYCLLIPLVALLLFVGPKITKAAEPDGDQDLTIRPLDHDINYVCVAFKDFPFMVLWQLKDMASSLKQEIPAGLSVGKEAKEDQGYLEVSYKHRDDGVLLSMSFHRLPADDSPLSPDERSPSLLTQESLLSNPSSSMIAETLRDLFSRFRLAWEQNQIPANEEEIALWHKDLGRPS